MLRGLLACALAGAACAATADGGTGFWAGGDIGISSLHRSFSVTGSTRDTEFAMALRGGYSWGEIDGVTSPPGITQDLSYRAWTLRLAATWR
jgi:hypothetical protein